MKTLYLVRHAKSSWDYHDLSDFERPLNGRGKASAPFMGKVLKKMGVKPGLIVSSPANRAITTASIIARELDYSSDAIQTRFSIYEAGISELLDVVNETNDEFDSLMLFGHNPGFTFLAERLSNTMIDNMPTCGVAAISFKTEKWSEVEAGSGKLVFFDYPKKHADFQWK